MERGQLPKLLDTEMKGLVVLGQIALVLVFSLPNRGISRLVDVGGDANVLRNASRILTLLLFFSDGRGCKRSLHIFFCSLEHRTKIRANWVDSRIVVDGLSGVILLLMMPCLIKSCHRHRGGTGLCSRKKTENAARAWRTRHGLYALEFACWDAWESLGTVGVAWTIR